jgi:uncharacterized protein (TIGR03437 family)
VSTTSRSGGSIFDDTRWWTAQKIVLPGLVVSQTTGRVTNPELTAQLNAAVESFDVDVSADFTGDASNNSPDLTYLRVRPYKNTVPVTTADDSGFDDQSFTNLLLVDSSIGSTGGFRHFSGTSFADGSGLFAVDRAIPDNSDVAFRLELQMRRNNIGQTGEGVIYDNLVVRLRVGDSTAYAVAANTSVSVDAASFVRAAAPGQILAAFGGGFPAGTSISVAASSTPLPTQLGNVSVRVNGVPAPLFFAGVGGTMGAGAFQVNYQLPYETAPGMAFVEVFNNDTPVTSEFLAVSPVAPGVFTSSSNGKGQAAALNQDFSVNGDPSQLPNSRPEGRGRFVIVYANGQGGQLVDAATQQPVTLATGAPAPANGSPVYATVAGPEVTIGGVPATVGFSGLAPGFVGLWQLNVMIPVTAPTGSAVPLIVTFGGRTSNVTTVAVN